MRLEYGIIAIFMLFMMAMGYVQRRSSKNTTSDYFRSGCRSTWWLAGASSFMAGISAYTFTGASGVAFESGWSVVMIYAAGAFGFFLSFIFTAHLFRQLRATTAPEVINMRFNKTTQQFYAWFTVVQLAIAAGIPLYALATFCSTVFGLDIYLVIIALGIIVIIYAAIGGKWAVMANDYLYCLVLFAVSILMAFLSLYKAGGISGLLELIQQHGLQEDFSIIARPGRFIGNSFTWGWMIAMFVWASMGRNSLLIAPKYFSVKDGAEARKAALFMCILMLLGSALWFFPPMVARLFYEQQVLAVPLTKPAEAAYAIISMQLLPKSLIGIVIVAMFSATMSSLDVIVNETAAIMVKDIYPTLAGLFRRKLLSDHKQVFLGQAATVFMGMSITASALVCASNKQNGIFELDLIFLALFGVPLVIPMLFCVFIRKVPSWSAMFTVGIGLISGVIGLFSEKLFGQEWSWQQKVFTTVAVGTAAFLFTRLFWRRTSDVYKKKVDDFFALMHKPVDFDKEVGQSVDAEQFKTLGWFSTAFGVFMSSLLIFTDEFRGRMCVLFIAGFMISIGLIMLYFARRAAKKKELKFIQTRDNFEKTEGKICQL